MKLTILIPDNAVYKNGVSYIGLDLSNCNIPANVWALQWNETKGWIEFQENDDGSKPANEPISELPSWANACVAVWDAYTPVAEVSVPFIPEEPLA